MKIRILIFLFITCILKAGESAEEELSRLKQAISAAMSQYDMNVASGELAKYWDRQLTKEEMKILASCDKETAVIFRKAQNTWREFRDAEVIFQGDAWRGGTIRPQMQNSSYASLTEQRVHDLQRYSQPQ